MTIEEAVHVCKVMKLRLPQVVSLYYSSKGLSYPLLIDKEDYNDLAARGFVQKNKPTDRYLDHVGKILAGVPSKAKPIKLTKKMETVLTKIAYVLNIENTVSKEEKGRVDKFFQDGRVTPFYFTWLYMFPTSDKVKNSGWTKLFGIEYPGVTLRKITEGSMKNFKRMVYKKDVGVYILATYLYTRDHIRDGRCFIPKITNFYNDQEDAYQQTFELVADKGENEIIALFSLSSPRSNTEFIAPGMAMG